MKTMLARKLCDGKAIMAAEPGFPLRRDCTSRPLMEDERVSRMGVIHEEYSLTTRGAGLYEITGACLDAVRRHGCRMGMVTVFCRHTSCSLVLMENADPSARRDLVDWLNRLVDPDDPHFTHTAEGPDDMPSHIKMALTRSSESIPIMEGQLALGTWQGLFLWEHRAQPQRRELVFSILG